MRNEVCEGGVTLSYSFLLPDFLSLRPRPTTSLRLFPNSLLATPRPSCNRMGGSGSRLTVVPKTQTHMSSGLTLASLSPF